MGPSKGAGLNLELKTHLNGHCNLFVQLLNAKKRFLPVIRRDRESLEGLSHQLFFVLAGFVAIQHLIVKVSHFFEARWVPISRLAQYTHTEAECATVALPPTSSPCPVLRGHDSLQSHAVFRCFKARCLDHILLTEWWGLQKSLRLQHPKST